MASTFVHTSSTAANSSCHVASLNAVFSSSLITRIISPSVDNSRPLSRFRASNELKSPCTAASFASTPKGIHRSSHKTSLGKRSGLLLASGLRRGSENLQWYGRAGHLTRLKFGLGANQKNRRHSSSLSVVALGHGPELGGALEVIDDLGLDTLTFLIATVVVIPAFKALKASPILGFLLSGVVLSQFGLIRNVSDVKALSELGILFLLFEMGLELSLARLKALAKFAFGIGLPQVLLTTAAFTFFELPPNNALGTRLLEFTFRSPPDLVNIRSVDEAIVIGAALSLSSSAFVLQLLAERGELPTRFGSATLGILLLQDIAVVPLLVILPILETGDFTDNTVFPLLAAAGLKALLGLGLLLLAGRVLLRRFFEVVADSRSPEAFVALCLLTVTGTALLTEKLGFSDSLGAFLAGALLAETNYRTQVEADIRPFRGLLLGLFFVTTGTSIDFDLLLKQWPNILALLGGLIGIKTAIITALGPRAGLSWAESIRTGLLLSQGGEFAFVVFSLANQLGVLPIELNQLLIIVVVLSMALTPLLDSVGQRLSKYFSTLEQDDLSEAKSGKDVNDPHFEASEPVVIIGFGQMAQVLANFLSTPLASGEGVDSAGWPYVSFDLDPRRVQAARRLGFPVLYGDGARATVLQAAGISRPKAVMVMYTGKERAVHSVERLRQAWPGVPIYARAQDLNHLLELKMAGATDVVLENAEASLRLGSILLQDLGLMRDDVVFLRRTMREAMDQRAREAYVNRNTDLQLLGPFQAKVRNLLQTRMKEGKNKLAEEDEEDPVGPLLRFEEDIKRDGNLTSLSTQSEQIGRVSTEVDRKDPQKDESTSQNGVLQEAGRGGVNVSGSGDQRNEPNSKNESGSWRRMQGQVGQTMGAVAGAFAASAVAVAAPEAEMLRDSGGGSETEVRGFLVGEREETGGAQESSLISSEGYRASSVKQDGDEEWSTRTSRSELRGNASDSMSFRGEVEDYDGSLQYATDDEDFVDDQMFCEGESCIAPEK